MNWKLFLDDERYPVDKSWTIARNFDDAVWYVKNYGLPYEITFDHDLGAPQNPTGAYMEDYELDFPDDFVYYIHSQNPVGAENIRAYMENFLRYYRG
jgi:hypothetical protein